MVRHCKACHTKIDNPTVLCSNCLSKYYQYNDIDNYLLMDMVIKGQSDMVGILDGNFVWSEFDPWKWDNYSKISNWDSKDIISISTLSIIG